MSRAQLCILICLISLSKGKLRRSYHSHHLPICPPELNIEDQAARVSLIFTGIVERVYWFKLRSYLAIIQVKQVIKGDSSLSQNRVILEGSINFCRPGVREKEKGIFFANLSDSGRLKLSFGVLRNSSNNIYKISASIKGKVPLN